MRKTRILLLLLVGTILFAYFLFTKSYQADVSAQQTSCFPIGFYCNSQGQEIANFDNQCAPDTPTGRSCVYDQENQCKPNTSCTAGSICDCGQFCVQQNIKGPGGSCCNDKGNVCQTGLSCVNNICTGPTSTNTPTPTTSADSPDNGRLVPTEPIQKEYFAPSFTSIVIQGMFFVLTLAIIFSVIR